MVVVKRVFFLTVLAFVSHEAAAQQDVQSVRRCFFDPSPEIVLVAAHRAPHGNHPENSLDAIKEAIEIGVDIVEIDVKVSKDGVPFLMHDHTLDRTTTGQGEAESYTWAQLQQFAIIDKGEITALKIPTLEEALQIAKDYLMVDLDLKTSRIDDVIQVVNKVGANNIVLFFDSDFKVLSQVRQANSDFIIMPRAHSTAEADSVVDVFDPPIVHIDFSFYNRETTRLIAESDARVWINALGKWDAKMKKGKVNRAIRKLTAYGANVIQTDEPEKLLAGLKRKGLHP